MDQTSTVEVNKIEDSVLTWSAPEHEPVHRSPDWFWGAGVIIFVIIAVSIILKNFLLALIILIGAVVLFILANREPETIHFRLTEDGLEAKHELFAFKQLESFWVSVKHTPPRLFIKTDRVFFPHIIIPLGNADPSAVRSRFKGKVKEVRHEESMIELVTEYLGF